ncbi:class I SAM-dependent methyltransferase [Sphingomonas sp. DBB INV C78]|uniref:class I SAM-dependent methyltransferase n=1 Tax=Sphingomonas sp. DBB INV C78 TaxID=3349434 RepID=UPI0036D351B9
MWLLDKMLRKVVRTGELIIIDYDGKAYRYGPGSDHPIRVHLTDKGASFHIAKDPRVGAGEAYMDSRLVVEPPHDIRDLVLFITGNGKGEGRANLGPHGAWRKLAVRAAARLDSYNDRRSARRNAEHTYNLTRELYELFLDEDRQYTMGYHRDPANGLEQAQLDKKAHIAAKLNLEAGKSSGMRVLDIGCGWGGLALYLHRHYDVDVLGVALAPDQIEFCRERARAEGVADRVKFELMDYRDVEGAFDRITSVGLLEHVGKPQYPVFFQHAHRLLKPDGVMFSHCCGRAKGPGMTDAWTRKYIFPGGYIPALSELVTESEKAGWQIMDVEAMRFHYSHTLEEWYRRTQLHRERIVGLYDERFYRMWEFYLAGAEQAFRHGGMVNWQIQYVKRRDAIPMTRDCMYEESARLRESDIAPVWHLTPETKVAAE